MKPSLNWGLKRGLGFRLAVAGSVLAAVLLVGGAAARAEDWQKSYTVAGRARVYLNTNDGSVRVTTADTKQIEMHVYYSGYKEGKDLNIEARQDGDSVQLTAKVHTMGWGSWGISHRSLRIEVHMPREADLQVETGDGSVEAQSISGSVKIHTGDGHISVDGARGDITLRTGDGSIEARELDGKVEANSGDGHVTLTGRFDNLDVKTGDGSIEVHALAGSKLVSGWNLRTGDGSVDLSLPGDLQANIDASTSDGRISLGIPVMVEGTFSRSEVRGKMNGGGQVLTVHTGDGSIRLSKS